MNWKEAGTIIVVVLVALVVWQLVQPFVNKVTKVSA